MTRPCFSFAHILTSAAFIAVLTFIGLPSASAQTETIIHTFQSANKHDGIEPFSGVIADANGVLYGTTEQGGAYGHGAIYKLSPPAVAGGAWRETILYSFTGGADGGYPQGNLLFVGGAIYGTTQFGGASASGVVYQLTHSVGIWTENVIYSFTGGSDGKWPVAGLVADVKGNLYGTTFEGGNFTGNANGYGVTFRLSPPQGHGWTETVLHAFTGGSDGGDPNSALIRDSTGALYGATYQYGQYGSGTIYKLAPPSGGGTWTKTVLYAFTGGFDGSYPTASPVLDSSGALYGTTSDGGTFNRAGTVYKLTPPSGGGGPWTQTTLYPFQNESDGGYSQASLILDSSGNLYGTTVAGGTGGAGVVFELSPPSGGSTWTETVLHTFAGGSDGGESYTPVLLVGTTLYGTTWSGGSKGAGTVFQIVP